VENRLVRPFCVSLRQRKGNHTDGQEQNYIKGTAQNLRLDGGVNLFFHFSSLGSFESEDLKRPF
jgi:hypothetical protein